MNLKNIINKRSVAAVGIGALLGATAYIINKKCGGKIMETTKKCAEAAKDVAKDVAEDITKDVVKEMVNDIVEESIVGKVLDNTEIKIDLNVADALDSIMKPVESFAIKALDSVDLNVADALDSIMKPVESFAIKALDSVDKVIDKVYERPLYVFAAGTLVLGTVIAVGNIKVRMYEAKYNKKTADPDYTEYSFNKADEYDFGDRTLFQ